MAECTKLRVCCDETDLVQQHAETLVEDLIRAFADCEASHCRSSLSPGVQLAHDTCCESCGGKGGQLTVQVLAITPTQQTQNRCRIVEWSATYRITSVRCVHVLKDDGSAPTEAELTSDTRKLLRDARVIRSTLECSFAGSLEECGAMQVGGQSFIGPAGGCGGVQQDVTVRLACSSKCGAAIDQGDPA